jgi:hypothetical protein
MTTFRLSSFTLTILLMASAGSFAWAAGVEQTPIPRDPKPNFSSMQFLLGRWNCMVDSARRPRPFRTVQTTSIDPSGYWMVTRTVTGKVPWNPITITAMDYVTYDVTTSRWIDISMDDYGDYDLSSSPGWIGNSMVWTDVAYPKLHGAATNRPRTFTKVSDAKTVLSAPFAEASGRLVAVTTTCTKRL